MYVFLCIPDMYWFIWVGGGRYFFLTWGAKYLNTSLTKTQHNCCVYSYLLFDTGNIVIFDGSTKNNCFSKGSVAVKV